MIRLAEQTTPDPLVAQVYTDSCDEQTRLEMAILSQNARLKTYLTRLQDTTEYLTEQARQTNTLVHHNSVGLEQQRTGTEQVATAVNEMATTTREVADSAQLAVDTTQKTNEPTSRGRDIATETRNAIQHLSESVGETGAVVSHLAQDSNGIGNVVDVIKGITDQTSLLTLDITIEAARADDQGRGSIVVTDEMHSLARHTTASTEQIHHLIAKLQNTADGAVHTMESGLQQAEAGVQRVLEANNTLVSISEAVSNIAGMTTQTAAAAEGQSAVAEEINRSINTIAALAEQTSDEALYMAKLSEELTTTTQNQYSLVGRFNR